ncbi:hypothetical protein L228DRAFT_243066 [Xylona heveae TC161]|uniref:YMC020W-like alpha/beta hydrolase domain-containing protein n=1 Tax=Xylona heveae (strain CBS 132557 / TC161) TaxID=1328760 RepID=A0A165JT19_XYLHT|nr:hypothetical protein L228DRAFT_243066 [Xylona heveae TC161]KZF26586.1 hypothetical protein L228DRAFT_243066 [Xylona heveae TC161]
MGPRKRSKPNPKGEAIQNKGQNNPDESTHVHHLSESQKGSIDGQEQNKDQKITSSTSNSKTGGTSHALREPKTWYGSSWPRSSKATPVTEVARESISAASNAISTSVSSAKTIRKQKQDKARSPSLSLSQGGASSRSLPCATTTTKLNVTSNPVEHVSNSTSELPVKSTSSLGAIDAGDTASQSTQQIQDQNADKTSKQILQKEDEVDNPGALKIEPQPKDSQENQSNTWRSWLFKFSNNDKANAEEQFSNNSTIAKAADQAKTDEPETVRSEGLTDTSITRTEDNSKNNPETNSKDTHSTRTTEPPTISRSWLGFFTANPQPGGESRTNDAENEASPQVEAPSKDLNDKPTDSESKNEASVPPPDSSQPEGQSTPARSSGWAFWSKGRGSNVPGQTSSDVGELAVADSPSQSQPERTSISQPKEQIPPEPKKPSKRERPESMELSDEGVSRSFVGPKPGPPAKSSPAQSPAPKPKQVDVTAAKEVRQTVPNLLLPDIKNTYQPAQNLSMFQHLSRLLLPGHDSGPRHLSIARDPPRIKRALAIGVHGYFPAPLIRTVLGQPTGTSIRFANGAAAAIEKWVNDRGYSCEIEKIALEGEGKIADRVDTLWKLMLNWLDHIRQADFILVACHSQGVPVALMLVAKLIAMGCVTSARIGVCAMAGVNLGPFQDYKSRFLSGSAGELFDFANPNSAVSKRYEEALGLALKHGVRIVYIGSIDDQLVSLESSTFSNISHPYIYRAVFVDGRIHAPDFITHLVGFTLKMRNLGISDHGLIRELSSPLAGSLYSGEGHSRVYDDQAVYNLAVEHALETTSIGDVPLSIQRYEAPTSANPYYLPWALRGLLEEDVVRQQLRSETAQLLQQYESWKPSSKVLKDVKFRLEAVRSKL